MLWTLHDPPPGNSGARVKSRGQAITHARVWILAAAPARNPGGHRGGARLRQRSCVPDTRLCLLYRQRAFPGRRRTRSRQPVPLADQWDARWAPGQLAKTCCSTWTAPRPVPMEKLPSLRRTFLTLPANGVPAWPSQTRGACSSAERIISTLIREPSSSGSLCERTAPTVPTRHAIMCCSSIGVPTAITFRSLRVAPAGSSTPAAR